MIMRLRLAVVAVATLLTMTGCGWRGANSLPLPGTAGDGPGAYIVTAQIADVDNMQRNSRVRVGDITVGNVEKIERQGWHALVTMRINGDVVLPANATATLGQTSLLGSKHIELAPPKNAAPEGRLRQGSNIPLASSSVYPSTERTLSAVSMLLNGGGIGQVQDITQALTAAFHGRESDLRSLIEQLNQFAYNVNDQIGDIIAATESLNAVAGQIADQKQVLDRAVKVIPDALAVIRDEREKLVKALDLVGKFSALATDSVDKTKADIVKELNDIGPVLQSLADSGPALTRSLNFFTTFPWVKDTLPKWSRGDLANVIAVIDLTLSRLDQGLFTGTRFEGNLTELELQWGRTLGQLPSPATASNPLLVAYRTDQER